jgi:hypothetical protein
MNGPIKNERKNLESAITKLEWFLVFAGGIVVAGLLFESWPELVTAAKRRELPARQTTGAILVTIGVAAEVVLANRIAHKSKKAGELADRDIAVLNAETERLRKENNETLILRSYRSVGNLSAFEEAMRPFIGTRYLIHFLPGPQEVAQLQWELATTLPKAGWIPASHSVSRPNIGGWVDVATVGTIEHRAHSAAGFALADWLDGQSVAVLTDRIIADPDLEAGTVIVQIGSKPETMVQYEWIREEFVRRKSLRPVTPPQA